MPLATLAGTIDETGISAPAYNDILTSLIESLQIIFGSDIYIPPDSQDYQLIAIFALAMSDGNNFTIAAYQSFAPAFAQGVGLSSLVKINGLQREPGTNSTASVVITGTTGTVIANGVVQDQNGNLWDLPASVTIPLSGTITVTATSQVEGAIIAAADTIDIINTVQSGWQTVNNPSAATVGVNVETDAALRQRQGISTSLPSLTPLQAILAAVANITGVSRSQIYENNTGITDANGVPGHSISIVVQGGSVTAIAQTIEATKSPGTGTYGTTSEIVLDPAGVPVTINFFELVDVQIYVSLTIQPLEGYVATTGDALIAAIVSFINSLAIGQEVFFNWIWGPASLYGSPLGLTYEITVLYIGTAPAPVGSSSIPIPFNEAATCSTGNVVLTTL